MVEVHEERNLAARTIVVAAWARLATRYGCAADEAEPSQGEGSSTRLDSSSRPGG